MNNIPELVAQLASKDANERIRAREALEAVGGHDVVRALVGELTDPREHVRLEAAKALHAIADPIAAIPLVHAMTDEGGDVRWVAAEAVAVLGEPGLKAVLSGLTRGSSSTEFVKAAHHALRDLRGRGIRSEVIVPVIDALEKSEPGVSAPVAALKALQQIHSVSEGQ